MPVRGGSFTRGELPRRMLSHSRDFLAGLITEIV